MSNPDDVPSRLSNAIDEILKPKLPTPTAPPAPPPTDDPYVLPEIVEATAETPYFQLGESKYGKPILDRVIASGLTLDEVAKCCLISMDSTIKSNLSVGLPLDLLCYERDSLRVTRHKLIDGKDPYFASIRERWAAQLRKVFNELPAPGYWS